MKAAISSSRLLGIANISSLARTLGRTDGSKSPMKQRCPSFSFSLMTCLIVVEQPLPHGVIATRRQGEKQDFVFLQNYGEEEQMLSLPDGFTDALTGDPVSAVSLPGFGVAVLCTTGTLAE